MALVMGRRTVAALRPWLLEYLLGQRDGPAFCVASDVFVLDSLAPLIDAVPSGGVLLVPHVVDPLPRDGLDPDETALLGVGMFSSGLYGCGQDAGPFVDFLKERLRRECVVDIPHMRMEDQRWLDFVPSLFPYRVERDLGVDAAYWNLHERQLSRADGRVLAGGMPLRTLNFSGFDPRLEGMLGVSEATGAPRVTESSDPLLAELCEEYRVALSEAGIDALLDVPSPYDALPSGVPIYDSLRALYVSALVDAEEEEGAVLPPDPFDSARPGEFLAWARAAFAARGLDPPLRLRPTTTPARARSLPALVRRAGRRRRPMGPRPEVAPPLGADAGAGPARDLLVSLRAGPAGRWFKLAVEVDPEVEGIVLSGTAGRLDAGTYRVTVEFEPGHRMPGLAPADQALVIEVSAAGHLLEATPVTFAAMESGSASVTFSIPRRLRREALSVGTDVRVRSRGRVTGALSAVLVERVGPGGPATSDRRDWLPVMDAGAAGRRAGAEVNAVADREGPVVAGPEWRLAAGRYRVVLRTRLAPPAGGGAPSGADAGVVAVLDTVAGGTVLGSATLTRQDVTDGEVQLVFEVPGDGGAEADPVRLRVRTTVGIPAVLESLVLEPLDD